MESGTKEILRNCGRSGEWFTYNDGSGVQTPMAALADGGANQFLPDLIPGGRGTSQYAAHTYGGGFTGYAGMGFTLVGRADGNNGAYDAASHGYTGISFYARLGSTQASAQTNILVQVTDKYSDAAGGLCNPAQNSGTAQCFDHPKLTIPLNTTWTLVTVSFASLARSGWGYNGTTPLDPTSLYTISFEDNGYAGGNVAPFTFDIWIDDVAFTP
jgi:hypothetical protein